MALESAVGAVDDSLNSIRTEWHVLKQKWFVGETLDPVFEGMIKDFCVFDVTMQDIYEKADFFKKGIDNLSNRLLTLSEAVTGGLVHIDDPLITSDSCKFKEATNQISRADAPHSAIAKIRRDMDFNIMNPIRLHLINNRNLKAHLDKRRRKLLELNTAKKHLDDVGKKNVSKTDKKYLTSQAAFDAAKMAFHDVDRHVFEWLYILEEYRGDILDSTLQTLKYLQYEFFATSAHAISGVLPVRMEFRPMVEMTPDHLAVLVEMELQEEEDAEEEGEAPEPVVTDFSKRLIEKMAKDNKAKPGDGLDSSASDANPTLPVDPLSLSSLMAQGFEEGPARRALRLHQNDTQAAVNWLLDGGTELSPSSKALPDVRMPTTTKRTQKLKARRRAQQEKLKRQEDPQAPQANDAQASANGEREKKQESAPKAAPKPMTNLLDFDDEPPPPTDFSKQVNVLELPPMMSFEQESSAAAAAGVTNPLQPSLPSAMAQPPQASGANAAMMLLQQGQISPEQLLQAAQQLMAAQQASTGGLPGGGGAIGGQASAPNLTNFMMPTATASPAPSPQASASPPGQQPTSPLDGLLDFRGF
mmetsp:Transcript_16274/g.37567  ORF Transcript_16274/g.37567 Transcript_16274/m.37567 type:complete len:586 (-) Transcript_16274:120-1877(-)